MQYLYYCHIIYILRAFAVPLSLPAVEHEPTVPLIGSHLHSTQLLLYVLGGKARANKRACQVTAQARRQVSGRVKKLPKKEASENQSRWRLPGGEGMLLLFLKEENVREGNNTVRDTAVCTGKL